MRIYIRIHKLMKQLILTILLICGALPFFAPLAVHAGIVLHCDTQRFGYNYYSKWWLAYDSRLPIGPLDIAIWIAAAVLAFVAIKKLKPWTWLAAKATTQKSAGIGCR
jgi:hypothetical protein